MSQTPQLGICIDECRQNVFDSVLNNMVLAIPGLAEKLESGICVADIACGVGRMTLLMAERFPKSTFWGLDIDDELLYIGQQRAKDGNLVNVHFEKSDAEKLPDYMSGTFDYVLTYDSIHDLSHPGQALREVYKSLKDGGVYSMIEPNASSSLKNNINKISNTSVYITSLYSCLPYTHSVFPVGKVGAGPWAKRQVRSF